MVMKDKEKQIEEIQGLLFCNKWEQPFTDCEENIKCMECIAKQIYNAGYRKLPKGAKVFIPTDEKYAILSKEEYERFCGQTINIAKVKAQSSKETAEKIIQLIKTFCPDKKFIEVITRIISERLGVEIKE